MQITFRGWSLRRMGPFGSFIAEKDGELPLTAGTLDELKQAIRNYPAKG